MNIPNKIKFIINFIPGSPIKFGSAPDDDDASAFPRLGEHTDMILSEFLGYTPERIKQLYADKILFKQT